MTSSFVDMLLSNRYSDTSWGKDVKIRMIPKQLHSKAKSSSTTTHTPIQKLLMIVDSNERLAMLYLPIVHWFRASGKRQEKERWPADSGLDGNSLPAINHLLPKTVIEV